MGVERFIEMETAESRKFDRRLSKQRGKERYKARQVVASAMREGADSMARHTLQTPLPDITIGTENIPSMGDLEIAKLLSRVEVVDPHFKKISLEDEQGYVDAAQLAAGKAKLVEDGTGDENKKRRLREFGDKVLKRVGEAISSTGGKKALAATSAILLASCASGPIEAVMVPGQQPLEESRIAESVPPYDETEEKLTSPQVTESVRPEWIQNAIDESFPDFGIKVEDVGKVLRDSEGNRYVLASSLFANKESDQDLNFPLFVKLGPNNQIDFMRLLVRGINAQGGEIQAASYDMNRDTFLEEGAFIRINEQTGNLEILVDDNWKEISGPDSAIDEMRELIEAADSSVSAKATQEFVAERSVDDILSAIDEDFGIYIPNRVSTEYSSETMPNALLSLEEAKILSEAISLIPGVDYLSQIIIPFKQSGEGAIPGGSYLGYQWPAFLHRSDYESFPYDHFVSKETAIELKIPDNVDMQDPLPKVGEEYSNVVLTPLLQITMNSAGIEANTSIEIPWTTHGERLRQAVVHETGHALLDKVLLADFDGMVDMVEYWERNAFTLYNLNTTDIENPLLVAFAKVNGWNLVSYADFVRQYDPEAADRVTKQLLESGREMNVWDRDHAIWGEIADRKVRITPYASYGPIQEAFCEYWMASILYPELLTPEEKEFFQRIHEGLRDDPEAFIQLIISNPDILLGESETP